METKRCPKCGEVKGLEEFNRRASRKDGLQAWCRCCSAQAVKASRAKNPERYRDVKDAWRKRNLDKFREYQARTRSKDPERYLEKKRALSKAVRGVIGDQYVKFLMRKHHDQPGLLDPEQVEAKRQQLLVYRALKEFQKLLKEQDK